MARELMVAENDWVVKLAVTVCKEVEEGKVRVASVPHSKCAVPPEPPGFTVPFSAALLLVTEVAAIVVMVPWAERTVTSDK